VVPFVRSVRIGTTTSSRVKAATKTALAMVLAYGVALSMDWHNAYWAGFAVAFCSLSTVGESLNKGLLRLCGTLLGGLVALTLISMFPQDRWSFLACMTIFIGFCTFMMFGTARRLQARTRRRDPTANSIASLNTFSVAVAGNPSERSGVTVATPGKRYWRVRAEREVNPI
jgi:hypothetical protein